MSPILVRILALGVAAGAFYVATLIPGLPAADLLKLAAGGLLGALFPQLGASK